MVLTNGATLTFMLHLAEAANAVRSHHPTLDGSGQLGGQPDAFHSQACTDGTLDVTASLLGKNLHLAAEPVAGGLHFSSQGGDLAADLHTSVVQRSGYDLVGTLDGTPVELHHSVHGMNVVDEGRIGDTPFHVNYWAIKDGSRLEGTLGKDQVMLLVTRDQKIHPQYLFAQDWKGTAGETAVDEVMSHEAVLTPKN